MAKDRLLCVVAFWEKDMVDMPQPYKKYAYTITRRPFDPAVFRRPVGMSKSEMVGPTVFPYATLDDAHEAFVLEMFPA